MSIPKSLESFLDAHCIAEVRYYIDYIQLYQHGHTWLDEIFPDSRTFRTKTGHWAKEASGVSQEFLPPMAGRYTLNRIRLSAVRASDPVFLEDLDRRLLSEYRTLNRVEFLCEIEFANPGAEKKFLKLVAKYSYLPWGRTYNKDFEGTRYVGTRRSRRRIMDYCDRPSKLAPSGRCVARLQLDLSRENLKRIHLVTMTDIARFLRDGHIRELLQEQYVFANFDWPRIIELQVRRQCGGSRLPGNYSKWTSRGWRKNHRGLRGSLLLTALRQNQLAKARFVKNFRSTLLTARAFSTWSSRPDLPLPRRGYHLNELMPFWRTAPCLADLDENRINKAFRIWKQDPERLREYLDTIGVEWEERPNVWRPNYRWMNKFDFSLPSRSFVNRGH